MKIVDLFERELPDLTTRQSVTPTIRTRGRFVLGGWKNDLGALISYDPEHKYEIVYDAQGIYVGRITGKRDKVFVVRADDGFHITRNIDEGEFRRIAPIIEFPDRFMRVLFS